MSDIEVDFDGPLLDGRADAALGRVLAEAKQAVADVGLAKVQAVLAQSLRTRTPYYETKLTVERAALDLVVTDQRVRYGPWLEGVSERNESTNFGGYHHFRTARQELERDAGQIADQVVRRRLHELGG